jgi:hypothetical protein
VVISYNEWPLPLLLYAFLLHPLILQPKTSFIVIYWSQMVPQKLNCTRGRNNFHVFFSRSYELCHGAVSLLIAVK